MSTAWLIEATGDDNTPLPPPWDGDVDIQDEKVNAALKMLLNTQDKLVLRVACKAFESAESRKDEASAAVALLFCCGSLYGLSQDRLADQALAQLRQRVRKSVDPSNWAAAERLHAIRLEEMGEFAQSFFVRQGILELVQAIGDNRAMFEALHGMACSAHMQGDPELALALYDLQAPLLPNDDQVAIHRRSNIQNNLACARLEIANRCRFRADEAAAQASLRKACDDAQSACACAKNDRQALHALSTLVLVLLALNDAQEARAQVLRWTATLNAKPVPHSALWCLLQLSSAQIDAHAGVNLPQALETLQAIEHLQDQGSEIDYYFVEVQQTLLKVYEQLGQAKQALASHKRLDDWHAKHQSTQAHQNMKLLRHSVMAMHAEAGEFITHDLKTPLAAAQAWMDALPAGGLRPSAQRQLQEAKSNVGLAAKLSDRYLGLLRVELLPHAGFEVLDLGALVDDVCENATHRQGVRLNRVIRIGTMVRGDRVLLTKALADLVADAFTRAPTGTQIQLELQHDAARRHALLSIEHQGAPPPPATRVRLYQNSFEMEPLNANDLGLALVTKVCRLHRMRLRLDSLEPTGARWRLKMATVS
jgi:signal transduction histidine kinase